MELPINSIVCGDNVEVMSRYPDECIDLVVTSPPYDDLRMYRGCSWDFDAVAQQLWRIIKPGGVVVWVVGDQTKDGCETGTSFRQALHFMDIGFLLHDTMIYSRASPFPHKTKYYQAFEYMFVLSKGKPKAINLIKDRDNTSSGVVRRTVQTRNKDGSYKFKAWNTIRPEKGVRENIWRYSAGGSHTTTDTYAYEHPAMFPEDLSKDHIISLSNEGDIVLDPFSGAGTTAKMARNAGRKYIGIEISPEYCEIANKRMRQKLLEFSESC